jgi:dipeptidyl aminopeptidase/acylaminoacyl peptidase
MPDKTIAPYGSFRSPISADLIVQEAISLRELTVDGADMYWLEGRPAEGGRYVIVRRTPDGRTEDVTPVGYNVRTTVHEYGGGSYLVRDGTVYFSNFSDQRLYRQLPGGQPEALSPEAGLRFADYSWDAKRARLICVREDHSTGEVVNQLVAVNATASGAGDVLVAGNDFYSDPRVSHDGSRLAWLTWNHPNMPWDGTELRVAELRDDGTVGEAKLIAGGVEESIFQPEWAADGSLFFVSDRTGWWNLYRWKNGTTEQLTDAEAEFGVPQWVFASRTYAVESPDRIVCSYVQDGNWSLATLDTKTRQLTPLDTPYTEIDSPAVAAGKAVFFGASITESWSVVELDLSNGAINMLKRSANVAIDEAYVSVPEPIEYPTSDELTAHAFFYAPRNRDYSAPEGERPPLLVICHGGPTGAASSAFNLRIQFWTTRGIAVVDVDYGGSTGFGREYRERLKDKWGIVDIDDCVNAALYLADRGDVDRNRLAIRGGSAGGYTTLAALAFRDIFKAGASYFGVSDLEALALDTHKFESRYLDGLIGPYPERRDLYVERSPIHHMEGFKAPMIVLQGLEDKVVPPNQAEMIIKALREKGVPVASLFFEGEQHGFRQAATIVKALNSELYFYSRIFGFEASDNTETLEIENL